MDRFIVKAVIHTLIVTMYLKSNMDRFIVYGSSALEMMFIYLKSNMDRFIEATVFKSYTLLSVFKIQYG